MNELEHVKKSLSQLRPPLTPEKAIEILQEQAHGGFFPFDLDFRDALVLAIQALRAQLPPLAKGVKR